MATTDHVNNRVKRHRAALRAADLQPIQTWVPDTRQPGVAEESRRQGAADVRDQNRQDVMEAALLDLDDDRHDA